MHKAVTPLLALAALLAASPARAEGTALWLAGEPDPTLVEGATAVTASQAAGSTRWSDRDDASLVALEQELAQAAPLLDVFDGELEILRRLDAALSDVVDLQEEHRALVHDARAFQGLAAERYFQDALATDPSAEPWRLEIADGAGGNMVVNRLYADAIAIDPETLPSAELVPDDEARLSYQHVRAKLLILPAATIVATDLPDQGHLVVDGLASPTDRARLIPGEHRVRVQDGDEIRLRRVVRVEPGQTLQLAVPADAAELTAFGQSLDGSTAVPLPARVQTTLQALEAPVTLVVESHGRLLQYRVAQGAAIPLETLEGTAAGRSMRTDDDSGLSFRAGLSAAWIYDGEWYLQNADSGAPEAKATVNGLAPGLHLGLQQRWGLLAVGAGVDGRFTMGQWQDLRVGESDWRLRLYPHAAAGLPWLQLTAGAWLPWRVGLGARGYLPLTGPLELSGGVLGGLGPTYTDADGADFQPGSAVSAWAGLSVRLGG